MQGLKIGERMNVRIKHVGFGAALAASLCEAEQPKRPNVVFILSDDHQAGLMSCAGNPYIKTPTLDSIAQNGVRFKNAFTTSPLCTPSRAGFLSGMYPERTGAPRICEKACSFLEFTRMFPEYLHEAGYQTAYVGKFHLGEGSVPKRGFDYWASWDWVGDPEDLTIYENGKARPTRGFSDDRIAEFAADFIRRQTDPDRQFFLYVGLKSPHLPYAYPDRLEHAFDGVEIPPPHSFYEDWEQTGKKGLIGTLINIHTFPVGLPHFKTWENYIKSYYRSTLSIDESVKTVLDAVRARGIEENTIFIYTTDHGYFIGEHSLSEKHFGYEEVMRIPMVLQYPAQIKGGQVNSELAINLDVAPTILDFCGVTIPGMMNGKSWKPMLTDRPDVPLREDFFFALNANDQPHFKSHTAVRSRRHKLIYFERLRHMELYDLELDPDQMVNRIDDPAYADTVAHLKQRLDDLKSEAEWSQLDNLPVIALYALDAFPYEWDEQVRSEIFRQSPVDYKQPIRIQGRDLEWKIVRKKQMGSPMDLSALFTKVNDTTYLSLPYTNKKEAPGHMQLTVSPDCNLAIAGWYDNRLMYESWQSSDLAGRKRKHMPPPHFFPYAPPIVPNAASEVLLQVVNRPGASPDKFQATVLFEAAYCDLLLQ
jgi:arylsulfatase A-like enzyme